MGSFLVRMRHGAPLSILGFVAIVCVFDLRFDVTSPVVLRAALATGALCWFVTGLALRARAWRVADTPVSKVRAATIGEDEFSGIAQSPWPQHAPASGVECAWYRWKLQHYVRAGKSSHWHTEQEFVFDRGFWLTDDTGSIWIDPTTADLDGFPTETLPGPPDRGGKWRQLEWRLPQGGPVYVLGPVTAMPNGQLLVASTKDSDADYLISGDSKRTVEGRLGRWAWVSLALGLAAAMLVPVIAVSQSVDSEGKTTTVPALHGNPRIALLIGAAFVAMLALSWLVRVYNRLVIVLNQARKAWASIEVQEQRRHDLIGNLVTVVQQYAAYEQQVQADVTALRARGVLPTDAEVQAATAQDTNARAEGARLVAVAEANPQLHANQQFLELQQALSDTETRIAFAREFYNDAVKVMRDRRQTFPYVLFTPLVPIPSLLLFGEDAPARPAALVTSS